LVLEFELRTSHLLGRLLSLEPLYQLHQKIIFKKMLSLSEIQNIIINMDAFFKNYLFIPFLLGYICCSGGFIVTIPNSLT
jgi:hypothetical protein